MNTPKFDNPKMPQFKKPIRKTGELLHAIATQSHLQPEKKYNEIDQLTESSNNMEPVVSPFTVVEKEPAVEEILHGSAPVVEEDSFFDYSNILKNKWSIWSLADNLKQLVQPGLKILNQISNALNILDKRLEAMEPNQKRFDKLQADYDLLKQQYDQSEKNLQVCSDKFQEFTTLFSEFRKNNPVLQAKNEEWFALVSSKINENWMVE